MTSKRTYAATWIEGANPCSDNNIHLADFIDNKTSGKYDHPEYIYAIADNLDPVLDLQVGEHLQMCFNRDNKDSWGIIKRIK